MSYVTVIYCYCISVFEAQIDKGDCGEMSRAIEQEVATGGFVDVFGEEFIDKLRCHHQIFLHFTPIGMNSCFASSNTGPVAANQDYIQDQAYSKIHSSVCSFLLRWFCSGSR